MHLTDIFKAAIWSVLLGVTLYAVFAFTALDALWAFHPQEACPDILENYAAWSDCRDANSKGYAGRFLVAFVPLCAFGIFACIQADIKAKET